MGIEEDEEEGPPALEFQLNSGQLSSALALLKADGAAAVVGLNRSPSGHSVLAVPDGSSDSLQSSGSPAPAVVHRRHASDRNVDLRTFRWEAPVDDHAAGGESRALEEGGPKGAEGGSSTRAAGAVSLRARAAAGSGPLPARSDGALALRRRPSDASATQGVTASPVAAGVDAAPRHQRRISRNSAVSQVVGAYS